MNFGQLQASVIQDLFPAGQPENLVASHNKFFVQAMADLQAVIPCLRYANTDFYPQCSTYFNCGLTVLPQPMGQVLRVCTIGRPSGQQTGASVADTTVEAPMVNLVNGVITPATTSGTLCVIETAGIYTISLTATNALKALYPANSPQYWLMAISYTDASGNVQTVQPAPIIHVSDSSQSGSLVVDVQAGSAITYLITSSNIPQTDGQISVEMSVVNGAAGSSNEDWCSKVYYEQVEYAHIERYVKACRGCAQNSVWNVANAIAAGLFGNWRRKRYYNPPTDIGFEGLPPLPPGFHYPQTSTDAGGRSRSGVYAIKHGRIYLAPWIESTESVIVEWNGIKTNWAATDLVTDDPKFIEAVRLLVGIQHYMHYEDNAERLADFRAKYYGQKAPLMIPGVQRELIIACRDRYRVRTLNEVEANEGDAADGVGITSGTSASTSIYYNAAQTVNGITVPAGAYSSGLSQADADAQAIAAGQAQSQQQQQTPAPTGYLNSPQTYTAQCPASTGTTPASQGPGVTITIAAGQYQSAISQALADAAALAAAQATAKSQLACTYYNAPQTVSVTCVDTTTETATIPAGQFTSTISQADADQQALAEAQKVANGYCSNPPGAYTIGNTQQYVPYSVPVFVSCGTFMATGTVLVPANTFFAQTNAANQAIILARLNQQAALSAQARIGPLVQSQALVFQLTCIRPRQVSP